MARLITFFDEETTGKLDPKHRIIELSMRVCDLDTQKEVMEKLWRFNPERNIDAGAFAVHGIPLDELKDKPLIKEVLPSINQILSMSDWVVSHNGEYFDVPFLKMETERNGLVMPKFKHFDTMKHGSFATDLGKSPSLKELAWCLDVDYDPALAHKGDYDTLVLRDSTFNGINRGWFKLEEEYAD